MLDGYISPTIKLIGGGIKGLFQSGATGQLLDGYVGTASWPMFHCHQCGMTDWDKAPIHTDIDYKIYKVMES